MPVSEIDSKLDTVGPYNRLSASQVNTYKSCKRMWFYEKVLKLKINQIPVLYVGRARGSHMPYFQRITIIDDVKCITGYIVKNTFWMLMVNHLEPQMQLGQQIE